MSLDVLVPFRGTTEHRLRLHRYTQALWSDLAWPRGDVRIYVASDGLVGPDFSVAAAVNRAYLAGSGENVIVFGSGHIPPTNDQLDVILSQLRVAMWVACFSSLRILSKQTTESLLGGEEIDPRTAKPERTVGHCMGILAMRREAFREVGGWDERFVGWGYEDTAFRDLLTRRYGATTPPKAALTTLWHPLASRGNVAANRALYKQQRGVPSEPGAVEKYLSQRGRFV